MKIFDLIQGWLSSHNDLATIIVAPLLVLGVTYILNRGAEKRAIENNRVERELTRTVKLAEFRQQWISDLRNEISTLSALLLSPKEFNEIISDVGLCVAKVNLLMNPNDAHYHEFFEIQKELADKKDEDNSQVEIMKLINIGQKILKTEWDRLKTDLKNVETLDSR